MNEAIEFQEERINALEGRRIIDVEANKLSTLYIGSIFMEKLFIVCTFDCSFQYYEETVQQWVKEQGEGIVIDYELVKINDNKSHSFYTVTSLDAFAKMLDTEWAREWDKANNCKDIVYKLELVE